MSFWSGTSLPAMASSLFSSMPSVSSSASRLAISSSSSSFVSIAHFHQQPLSQAKGSGPIARFPPVECSSRPRKKCTAHHNKTRPKKHSRSEKNRKPTVYPKPPTPPPSWTLGWGDEDDASASAPTSATRVVEPAVVGG